tara:strand:+ start:167 stop:1639 length:1473 start_codon:yes stop_codon:yes gene_type:complete
MPLPFLRSAKQYLGRLSAIILTLEQQVAAMLPDLWLDGSETYAKSKIACEFDGTNDYMSVTDSVYEFGWDDSFSGSCWVSIDAGGQVAFFGQTTSGEKGWWLNTINGISLVLQSNFGTDQIQVNTGVGLTLSTWTHVAFTYSGTRDASGCKLYVNGVSQSLNVPKDGMINDFKQVGASFYVARSGGTGAELDGQIDQVQIFDTALTGTQMTALYNSTAGLNYRDLDGTETFYSNIVAWYDMNVPTNFGRNYAADPEGSLDLIETGIDSTNAVLGHVSGNASGYDGVTKWTDRGTQGNDATQATATSIPTWLDTDDSVSFDGSNDHLSTSTFSGYFDGVTDKDWSVSWLQFCTAGDSWVFGQGGYPTIYIYIGGGGNLIARSFDRSKSSYYGTVTSALPFSQWQHIVVKYTASTNTMNVYMNGTEISGSTSLGGTGYVAMENFTSSDIGIFGAGSAFKGKMRQMKTFKSALSEEQIATITAYYNEKYTLSL